VTTAAVTAGHSTRRAEEDLKDITPHVGHWEMMIWKPRHNVNKSSMFCLFFFTLCNVTNSVHFREILKWKSSLQTSAATTEKMVDSVHRGYMDTSVTRQSVFHFSLFRAAARHGRCAEMFLGSFLSWWWRLCCCSCPHTWRIFPCRYRSTVCTIYKPRGIDKWLGDSSVAIYIYIYTL